MRNRLVHVYFQVNLDILWDTVKKDIPKLIEELENISELMSQLNDSFNDKSSS